MITEETVNRIVFELQQIEQEYINNPGMILSEDDLKCHLFGRIKSFLPQAAETADMDTKGSPLHSEIPFYDEKGKLTIRPDITIFNPKGMSIKHGMSIREKDGRLAFGRLPSKGFEFGGRAIVIELKFIKANEGISDRDVWKIRADIEKIQRLMERHNRPEEDNHILGLLVVFNKTTSTVESFGALLSEFSGRQDLRIVYGTGRVEL